jgi:hypothetical protein
LSTQNEEVLDALKEEEKFTTFLKGIKALYQIIINISDSIELVNRIDTKYAMDIEVFCQEVKQSILTMQKILNILDERLGISSKLMKPISMKEKILNDDLIIDEGFT